MKKVKAQGSCWDIVPCRKKFENNTSLPFRGLLCMMSLQRLTLKGWNAGGMWAVVKEKGVLRVHSLHW